MQEATSDDRDADTGRGDHATGAATVNTAVEAAVVPREDRRPAPALLGGALLRPRGRHRLVGPVAGRQVLPARAPGLSLRHPDVAGDDARTAVRAGQARDHQRHQLRHLRRGGTDAPAAQGGHPGRPDFPARAVRAHRGGRRVPALHDVRSRHRACRCGSLPGAPVVPAGAQPDAAAADRPGDLRWDAAGRGAARPVAARDAQRREHAAAHPDDQSDPRARGGAPHHLRPGRAVADGAEGRPAADGGQPGRPGAGGTAARRADDPSGRLPGRRTGPEAGPPGRPDQPPPPGEPALAGGAPGRFPHRGGHDPGPGDDRIVAPFRSEDGTTEGAQA